MGQLALICARCRKETENVNRYLTLFLHIKCYALQITVLWKIKHIVQLLTKKSADFIFELFQEYPKDGSKFIRNVGNVLVKQLHQLIEKVISYYILNINE
jgi:hypothetical protein